MCVEDSAVLALCLVDTAQSTADIPKALHYFEQIRMPRVAKVVEYGRMGMHIWTLPGW